MEKIKIFMNQKCVNMIDQISHESFTIKKTLWFLSEKIPIADNYQLVKLEGQLLVKKSG
jgi:hypothetical protein